MMFFLVPVFTLGYIGYIPLNRGLYEGLPDLLVPAIFLLGGCFACTVVGLTHSSVEKIRPITRLEHESITDPQSADTAETLIARADDALYRTKQDGRNRCEASPAVTGLSAAL